MYIQRARTTNGILATFARFLDPGELGYVTGEEVLHDREGGQSYARSTGHPHLSLECHSGPLSRPGLFAEYRDLDLNQRPREGRRTRPVVSQCYMQIWISRPLEIVRFGKTCLSRYGYPTGTDFLCGLTGAIEVRVPPRHSPAVTLERARRRAGGPESCDNGLTRSIPHSR